jgi:hypothetical protein
VPHEAQPALAAIRLAIERASGSVVETCVSFERFFLWKLRSPLRPGAGGSPEPSFGRKLFIDAQASISVPSSEKCSLDNSFFTCGSAKSAELACRRLHQMFANHLSSFLFLIQSG